MTGPAAIPPEGNAEIMNKEKIDEIGRDDVAEVMDQVFAEDAELFDRLADA